MISGLSGFRRYTVPRPISECCCWARCAARAKDGFWDAICLRRRALRVPSAMKCSVDQYEMVCEKDFLIRKQEGVPGPSAKCGRPLTTWHHIYVNYIAYNSLISWMSSMNTSRELKDGWRMTSQGATLRGLEPQECEEDLWAFCTFLREAIYCWPHNANMQEWEIYFQDVYTFWKVSTQAST